MKHIRKFNESNNICTNCNGTGKVDFESTWWGDTDEKKCDECNGSGKGSIQLSNIELKKFINESQKEFESILGSRRDKYDSLKYGFIKTEVIRYSDDENDEVEKIKIETQIYYSSDHNLNKEFFDKIDEVYIDYNIFLDTASRLILTVYKAY